MPRTEQFAIGAAMIASALAGILHNNFLAYTLLIIGVGFIVDIYLRDFLWGADRPSWEQIQKQIQEMSADEYKERVLKNRKLERWVNYIAPDRAKKRAKIMRWVLSLLAVAIFAGIFFALRSSSRNAYEVLERTEKVVPNFQESSTHTAIQYVLMHSGHKIYATCDIETVNNIDPNARCGFRPLRTYECVLGDDRIESTATLPFSDLKCKDSDGHNVYLYVDKEE
jgi:hypothetical protein